MDYEAVREAADYIRTKTDLIPSAGIILGSGLGGLVEAIKDQTVIPYDGIPHFPVSHLAGHAGNLVLGKIGACPVAAMQGRFHYYQGYTMAEVTFPIFVMKMLGVKKLIVTNACGGINTSFRPGDLMIITDYINMLGTNPLIGTNDERFGVQFPDMSEAYDHELIAQAEAKADELKIHYQKGVYALFPGPCYETAAEIRAYKALGADAVGMSTVPETIAADYLGMKLLGIACITNMATGIAKTKHSHEEVLAVAEKSSRMLCAWVKEIILAW
jgi:purine-nucleoside phosphorylase